jgi:hypothetical protein
MREDKGTEDLMGRYPPLICTFMRVTAQSPHSLYGQTAVSGQQTTDSTQPSAKRHEEEK